MVAGLGVPIFKVFTVKPRESEHGLNRQRHPKRVPQPNETKLNKEL